MAAGAQALLLGSNQAKIPAPKEPLELEEDEPSKSAATAAAVAGSGATQFIT